MPPRHFPVREEKALAAYVVELLGLLGMPAWRLHWHTHDLPPEGALASVLPTRGRYVAEIWLCADWMKRPVEERRDSITHEILHLLHRDLTDWIEDEVGPLVFEHEFKRIDKSFHRVVELMVDRIALFMANTQPLTEAWERAYA
jgi:hypothetical protein